MTFSDIYGHPKPLAILRGALTKNRIAHAYLFYGMEGIGKRAIAALFARALACAAPEPPCDLCDSCRKALHQCHLDIVTIHPEGQFIKIGAVKELQEQMTFRPSEGRRRVFLIPEADRMNAPAANALLKTLEEPTAGNVLLLTTSRSHALPMTILSRCQHLRFTPLPADEVARYLREKKGLDEGEASVLAASSGGSIGRALAITGEDFLARRDALLERLQWDGRDAGLARLALAAHFGTEREEILDRLAILRTCFRDALVLRETAEAQRLVFRDRHDRIAALAERLSGQALVANIATVDAAVGAIGLNANKSLTLETMVFKLSG